MLIHVSLDLMVLLTFSAVSFRVFVQHLEVSFLLIAPIRAEDGRRRFLGCPRANSFYRFAELGPTSDPAYAWTHNQCHCTSVAVQEK